MKKKTECDLSAKMAFYKNSKPSQQTLIFHSPPPFHLEPPLPATGSEKRLQSFKLWAQWVRDTKVDLAVMAEILCGLCLLVEALERTKSVPEKAEVSNVTPGYVMLCCVVLCCVAFDLQLFSCFVENTVVVTVKYLYEWDNLVSEMVASILLWWNVKLGSDSMQTILCIWFVCLRSVSLYNGFHSSLSAIICYFLSTFDISVLLPFIYPILISQKVY